MAVQTRDIEVADGAHVVKFYEHDAELVASAGPYLAAAIHAEEVAVMIATEAHRRAFEAALEARGVDLPRAKANGRLVSLDAAATLSEFRTAGEIDHDAFREVVGGVVRSAAAAGRPVRAYGEMVALLWDAGDVLAAIELERLWHELAGELPFTLFCSYPAASVAGSEHAQALAQICHLHSSVLGSAPEEARESAAAGAQTGISALFSAEPGSPGLARRLVVDALRRWGAANTLVNDVALVVSELATNAVRHAESSFTVTVRASGSTLRIAVHDGAPLTGIVSEAWLIPQPLHGLSLVDALCTRWGVEDTRDGKLVWAELPYEAAVAHVN
ncbi:MAG: histidine kinase [Solirubrobacterales bacterium]|nr:histidine kinase [Solirubrobacterales bacterium]